MNYDFESYLLDRLNHVKNDLSLDVDIYVSEEQNFAKMDELTPNSIYIVIKYLSSSIEYYAETMPIQLLILSEQNSLNNAKMLMNKFTNDYNWNVISNGTIYVKQQYNSPVVLNNYVEVAYGYRSVLYVTGTLFVMENLVDVKNLTVDGVSVTPLSFNIAYSMSTNTQQLANKYIASSVKTVSTFSLSMSIPMIDSDLVTKVTKILNEEYDSVENIEYNGNNNFNFAFTLGISFSKPSMKLISAQIITAPNQIPTLQLGFME